VGLTSRDVIHSFWVPRLAGKLDAIPGRRNEMWVQANEPGLYRGQCAELCGAGHAHMAFALLAMSREDYQAWLRAEREAADTAQGDAAAQGRERFFAAGC